MLAPLIHSTSRPVDPQVGSVLVLLYPLAIAYATVRYRLFDATVVIRRSVVYTMLAGLITGAYALLARAAPTRSWPRRTGRARRGSRRAFMFAVVLAVQPAPRMGAARGRSHLLPRALRLRARRIQALARSMASLLDLDEITRRLTTTIEAAMHVREARLLLGRASCRLVAVLAGGARARCRATRSRPIRASPR